MEYTKPALTYEQQADLAISRGLAAERDELVACLESIGYYRLSGYWHIFKDPVTGLFYDNATLERVCELYDFDRRLKLLVFDAVERVEVYLRTQLAYELAHDSGPFGYLREENLPNLNRAAYDGLVSRCRKSFDRSREPFALHFKRAYGDEHELPPYWIMVNMMDFGMVFTLYRGAPNPVRKKIAEGLGVAPRVLDSWLLAINTTRNVCAHHGRLWNRVLGTRALTPRAKNDVRWHEPYEVQTDRPFMILTVLACLMETVAPECGWQAGIVELVSTRSASDMERMGFTGGWERCPFWSVWTSDDKSADALV